MVKCDTFSEQNSAARAATRKSQSDAAKDTDREHLEVPSSISIRLPVKDTRAEWWVLRMKVLVDM
jgi:hypothetical protein